MKITFLKSEEISTKVWFKFKLEIEASRSPDWFKRGSRFEVQALIWLMVYSKGDTKLEI